MSSIGGRRFPRRLKPTVPSPDFNGCAGDPPGYPTYFTRSIYTANGDSLPYGTSQTVITYEDKHYIVDDTRKDRLHTLWKPLPLDHPRTLLWIQSTYKHHQHCYNGYGNGMLIYPVPYYKLKLFRPDPKWKDEFVEAHRVEVEDHNTRLNAQAKALATPENHNAYCIVSHYYPNHKPDMALIKMPPDRHVGQWWETLAAQPSEEDCAQSQRWGHKHPFNGTWCQWCGR